MNTFKTLSLICIITAVLAVSAAAGDLFLTPENNADIYHDTWIDFNKNGRMDVYEDPTADEDARINDLLSQMTVEEKTAQMATLYGYRRVVQDALPTEEWKNELWKDGIGNIDEHLNNLAYHPQAATEYAWPPSKHARAINEVQRFFVEETRMGIPVDFTNEGIRGLCHQGATSFPAQIGQGSTWDVELIGEIGRITGSEARALGYTNIYSPILDLARDPRWGRTVECYTEDPFLGSELGKAMARGLQSQHVASTGKHFAVYSVPKGGRDGNVRTDPQVSQREAHEILLKPFRAAVTEAGVLGLMSSYNDYDGVPVSASSYFLTDLLRGQWGFEGYIVSDSGAVEDLVNRHHVTDSPKECVYRTVMAGLNIRTDFNPPINFVGPLRELVAEGRIPMSVIDERVGDVLRVKMRLGLFDQPYVADPDASDSLIRNEKSVETSLRATRESLVLLKNDGLLPVDPASVKTVLVTGPNADAVNPLISRYGPSQIDVVTILEGIKNLLGDKVDVRFAPGCDYFGKGWPESELYDKTPTKKQRNMISKAVEQAEQADLIIAVLGDNENTVGEGKSRTSLDLPGDQEELIKRLHKTGNPVVGVLINGRPMTVNWMHKYVPAIIEAWFPGEFAGTAVAEVIFGLYNPGGRLSITFPKTVGQLPFNFPHKSSSQLDQPLNWPEGVNSRVGGALYPFGYGLSYTTFEYSDLQISPEHAKASDEIKISFNVKNTGDRAGDEVPQLYISDVVASVVTYEKRLRGFRRIHLEQGASERVEFVLQPQKHLALFDKDMKEVVEPGLFKVYIGASSEDNRLKGEFTIVE